MVDETEIWRPVLGYKGLYEISNQGRVRSIERTCPDSWGGVRKVKGGILKLFMIKGYLYVNLNNIGLRQFRVHKLVALAFISNLNNLPVINHKDGNKLNNLDTNLEWCTTQENTIHAVKLGLLKGRKGESHHNNSLSGGQVKEIRQLLLEGAKGRELANTYKVCEATISNIKLNKNWIE